MLPELTQEQIETTKDENGEWKKGLPTEALLEIFKDFKGYETDADMFERVKVVRKFFRSFVDNLGLKNDEKVAVVAHSKLIASLTAKGLTEAGNLKDFLWLNNCDSLPFTDF